MTKNKCKNCGFLKENHIQGKSGCDVSAINGGFEPETMTKNKTEKQEDWIKEFDKKFCYSEMINGKVVLLIGAEIQPEEIKSFIRQLLEKARDEGYECGLSAGKIFAEQAIKEERKWILENLPKEIELGIDIKLTPSEFAKSWNDCLKEIKELLK